MKNLNLYCLFTDEFITIPEDEYDPKDFGHIEFDPDDPKIEIPDGYDYMEEIENDERENDGMEFFYNYIEPYQEVI